MNRCHWSGLKNHYEPEIEVTDQHTETFFVRFSDNSTYTVGDYAYSSPNELRSTLNFLDNLSCLVKVNYIKSSPLQGNHFFYAALAGMLSQEDSINYLQEFDSNNYHAPFYKEGLKALFEIFKTAKADFDSTME